ncbi:potassium-transporting ATPase A chain [Gordonia araii NBRC 100433]|uniref:Potassium-transporting ATPase potassium-binding subunit n=1 Tax=Gordonia araii NBRC 100433 TaxID=1073574 RepID=G7H1N0_9ACTN|nr:potassium-transporting ATPase subunit KdpA [Gordonia araii]NNG98283.1 potassium-transporting ATPase subunit KdpA [Gordonia araii NBRC 100433]GAB09755.1 potassium-transporting ATPase A chain [Gordonia araii NBRC 100433]
MSDTASGLLQVAVIVVALAALYIPLGDYMASVYRGTRDLAVERLVYRAARVDSGAGQSWRAYAISVLSFSAVSILVVYALQRFQGLLPWADGKPGVSPAMAFNTAISFVTNTNWQSYSPELVMSNLVQMLGLAVQNFVSAAVGMAVAIALVRGIASRAGTGDLGNFWVDLVRGTVRILLPIALIVAVVFLAAGAVQSWRTGVDYTLLDGRHARSPVGPFASQEAIKLLGTNGGGTLAANSAHPFANPTPLTNVVQVLAILVIPVCLTRTYGTLVGDRRQGLTLLAVMAALWSGMLALAWYLQTRQSGLEGIETRFGVPGSILFGVSTTGTSTGAVNAAHDSLAPGSGGVLLWNMLLGEIAPGGVGSGLYGILVLAITTVFVGGLMVGRTPEFGGKKVGRREMTLVALYLLTMPAIVLSGAAITLVGRSTPDFLLNSGPHGSAGAAHGFTEVLYAYASAANNNGSAFGGFTVTTDWFQISLGLAMFFGRLLPILLVLALAGLLAEQIPRAAVSADAAPDATPDAARLSAAVPDSGLLPTHGVLFGVLLVGTVVLVAGLTFLPAMALGPIAEALL